MMIAAMTWWTMVNTARAMKTNQTRKKTCSRQFFKRSIEMGYSTF